MATYERGIVLKCPNCGSTQTPILVEKTSIAGWIVFGIMIIFIITIPWCKVGLNMKDRYYVCHTCGAQRI